MAYGGPLRFARFVGLRFLRPKRRALVMSIISVIALIGVAVGVATLVVVMAAITGYQEVMTQKILGAYSHLLVLSHHNRIADWPTVVKKISQTPGVRGVSPFVYGEVMASTAADTAGVVLRGINPASDAQVTGIGRSVDAATIRQLDQLREPKGEPGDEGAPPKLPGIILGKELATRLEATVGSRVFIVNPMGEVNASGVTPKSQAFVVIGLSHSGMFEFDSTFAFIGLAAAQQYFGYGDAVSGVEVSVTDIWRSEQVGDDVERRLGWPYYTRDWKAMNRNLFSALKLQKLVMFVILCLIVFVAALNIFSTLYMVIMDKKRSLAMMRAMGASAREVRQIVFVQGMFIGVLGSIIGAILGVALCLLQTRVGLVRLDPSVYFIDTLPMTVKALDLLMISVAALGFSLIATLLPARMAARMDAVTVLRYE